MLNKHGEAARQRREAADASATPEERVAMYAAKQQRAKLLRKQEVSADSGPPLARTPGLNAHITVQRLEALA